MTEKEVGQLFTFMSGIWSMMKVDTATIKLWHKLIGEISYHDAEKTIYNLAKTKEFPPTPADILKLCVGSPQSEAKLSFDKVYGLIGKYGFNGYERAKNEMTEAEINAIKHIGGWRSLCEFNIERNTVDKLKKQFVEAYESVKPAIASGSQTLMIE